MRTGIAAILDQRDLGLGRAQGVIHAAVHRPVQPVGLYVLHNPFPCGRQRNLMSR